MTVGSNGNSQYEPTTQIHASNLLRAIREAGRHCRHRRYESSSERGEGAVEQHSSVEPEKVCSRRRKGDERNRERELNIAGIL